MILFDRPADVYHVTVMPCYDKKLEASRDDFVFEVDQSENNENEGLRVPEVDSVLTSGEVLDLIQVRNTYYHLHFSGYHFELSK